MTRWLSRQTTDQYRWRKIIMIMIWTCVENLDELFFLEHLDAFGIWIEIEFEIGVFLGSDKLWAERCDQHWRRKVHHHLQWVLQPYSFGVILMGHFEMYSSAMFLNEFYIFIFSGMYFGVRWKEPRLKNFDNTTMWSWNPFNSHDLLTFNTTM